MIPPSLRELLTWLGIEISLWAASPNLSPAQVGCMSGSPTGRTTTACLLVAIGQRLMLDHSTALLGATLYLLNFCVANFNLAGLVDSAEGCFVMFIVWSLLTGRWLLLPFWGFFGALAKETFAPLSVMFVFGWWMSEVRRDRLQLPRFAWICALSVVSIATVTLAMSTVAGALVWPWRFAGYMHADHGFLAGLWRCVFDHTFYYIFIWLLPLGLVRLRRFPRPWIVACHCLAFCGALALGAYITPGANFASPLQRRRASLEPLNRSFPWRSVGSSHERP